MGVRDDVEDEDERGVARGIARRADEEEHATGAVGLLEVFLARLRRGVDPTLEAPESVTDTTHARMRTVTGG